MASIGNLGGVTEDRDMVNGGVPTMSIIVDANIGNRKDAGLQGIFKPKTRERFSQVFDALSKDIYGKSNKLNRVHLTLATGVNLAEIKEPAIKLRLKDRHDAALKSKAADVFDKALGFYGVDTDVGKTVSAHAINAYRAAVQFSSNASPELAEEHLQEAIEYFALLGKQTPNGATADLSRGVKQDEDYSVAQQMGDFLGRIYNKVVNERTPTEDKILDKAAKGSMSPVFK